MEEGRPSATAMIAARMRAAHMLWDDAPKIFQDSLALGLSGVESETALQATLRAIQAAHARRSTPEFAQVFRITRAAWSCDSGTRKTSWTKLWSAAWSSM